MRVSVLICSLLLLVLYVQAKPMQSPGKGPGFAFSGAGGRLAQHLALMEVLIKGLQPDGEKVRPSYLAGASSGSISAVALNAILETEDTNNPDGFTWEDYKDMIFNLSAGQIYDNSWEGMAKIFTVNLIEGYILDNSPLKELLGNTLAKMGYKTLGDLYIPTSISLVNQSSGLDTRVWSTDPEYAGLDLLEVMMASTALPIAFPTRTITGFGNTVWIDGGTGIDTIPVYPLVYHPNVTEIYIICYGSAMTSGGSSLPPDLDYIKILKNSLATIDDMRVDLFAGAIDVAKDSTIPSFTYIPSLNQSFSALDFDHEYLEYDLAFNWAIQNNPSRLT